MCRHLDWKSRLVIKSEMRLLQNTLLLLTVVTTTLANHSTARSYNRLSAEERKFTFVSGFHSLKCNAVVLQPQTQFQESCNL